MSTVRVAVLGAGPAGVAAAWQLHRQGKARVVVCEQGGDVGGNAGSFELDGVPVDYGSHRLHPSCQPEILHDLRTLLADDLRERVRHGRIHLRGRWVHFPLKPLDLLLHLPPSFAAGVAVDALRKPFTATSGAAAESFASVLERNLGTTICNDFYFPYAVKIWGVPPQELSATQAYRRVSAGSLGKMARKALGLVPGFKAPGAGRFFYPRGGYGQISRAVGAAARDAGADIRLHAAVRRLRIGSPHRIEHETDGVRQTVEAEYVWSTIPVTTLARIVEPPASADVIAASRGLDYRAMILIYLVLAQPQFTPFDAHYFPGADIQLTRLSEPKNYSGRTDPPDRTVLCGELPCTVDDPVWRSSDDELAGVVRDSLARCGLPIAAPVLRVVTKRLAHAYPIYRCGYEGPFGVLDAWASGLDRVLTLGRQGLFAHDNTHHTLAMAYAAVDCLDTTGRFDAGRWQTHRREFERHVVED